jgi:hypothetical protein
MRWTENALRAAVAAARLAVVCVVLAGATGCIDKSLPQHPVADMRSLEDAPRMADADGLLPDRVAGDGEGFEVGPDGEVFDASLADVLPDMEGELDVAGPDLADGDWVEEAEALETDAVEVEVEDGGDVADEVCVPDCAQKECGDDGCGGSCGSCDGLQDECIAGVCLCQPACGDKECGDDGCGGSCGACVGDQTTCVEGQCVCQPACTGKVCGADGCGGSCGDCTGGQEVCLEGECLCLPDCTDRECGSDGCTGLCGSCGWPGDECVDGQCVCTPECVGKACGANGCGGSCGSCVNAQEVCIEGACVCIPACNGKECGGDGCGNPCGLCDGGKVCKEGSCVCLAEQSKVCCGDAVCWVDSCGVIGQVVAACPFGCGDGKCLNCVPDCAGKACGEDGCGGSCGDCPGAQDLCVAGACACQPDCADKECGDDGCGGSCGGCDDGVWCTEQLCQEGTCYYPLKADTCRIDGVCYNSGQTSPGGVCLTCVPGTSPEAWSPTAKGTPCGDGMVCFQGSCCDHAAHCQDRECGSDDCGGNCGSCLGEQDACFDGQCVCVPACEGKECGADGCGGSCGTCPGEQDLCIDSLCICQSECLLKECGTDGCGGSCGTCVGQTSCTVAQKCGVVTFFCGNGTCDDDLLEDCDSCPEDCGACCGDGECSAYHLEECWSCPEDCPWCAELCDDGGEVSWDGCTDNKASETLAPQVVAGAQDFPAVAGLAGGGFVISWQGDDEDGSGWGIFARRFDEAGLPMGDVAQVNQVSANHQEAPAIAGLPDGGFVVVWQSKDQDGDDYGIYGRKASSDGLFDGNEIDINPYHKDPQLAPTVAALSDGRFVVSWQGAGGADDEGVWARHFNADGTPDGGATRLNQTTGDKQEAPALAALPDGRFVAAWQSKNQDGGGWGVYCRLFDEEGQPESGELQVNLTGGGDQLAPAVAGLPDGGFVVAFHGKQDGADGAGIHARWFTPPGEAMGAPIALNETLDDTQENVCLAISPKGTLLAAWESQNQDGSGDGVFGRVFSHALVPATDEFPAGLHLNNNQHDPDCACLVPSCAETVVVWTSKDQDGSGEGVFFARFNGDGVRLAP